ncbi:bifunctional phosphopantothenoylcysteine decarboxylase/phosphopantothenate--cysteine ligase CoaBC [Thalassobacillus sp. CUG 92003]|uniref:bifunctional phosphopantothenoylcysteine decarboxylase/phosphopantothenate--cysteine ligase CoaBC n=1 Tax=Thalassobacillus sp. CUG 92003 TaxID=2736641 RepID=UPI0015E6B00E|nr:bifunctional phosphopantothenoylcysteine decarboxylase/phosphopantothenate--cysteine ligase CoaBC [Thalassobacillus sp. CUG 92003]
MLKGKKIMLGVSGGIAAYKACALTSKLVQSGAEVKVVMTESATKFVNPLTFQALSREPVYTDTFDEEDPSGIQHIDVADWADVVLLAPATANILGKLSNGIADDMLSTTLLATEAPVYIAPAMNVHMYAHPSVIQNMQRLDEWGFKFIEPGEGYLACGYVGKGRLEEPETIIQVLEKDSSQAAFLHGRRVLITAGPTRERIDPVRYFSNPSSGKMGFALARQAARLGADVTLITGPVELATPSGVNRIDVMSAEDMYQAVLAHFEQADIVIKAAAVADYRPKHTYQEKMKKQPGDYTVEMERTKDILYTLGEKKSDQFLVGFAAESERPLEYGLQKLSKKNLDAIVVNNIKEEGAGFGQDTNIAVYVNKQEHTVEMPIMSKDDLATKIFEHIANDLKDDLL